METPKTWQEYGIWVLMQFPVLGAAALVAWVVSRETGKRYREMIEEIKSAHRALLGEKDVRISERDVRIGELGTEIAELKARLRRTRKPKPRENPPPPGPPEGTG
jgi:hypothetical protein